MPQSLPRPSQHIQRIVALVAEGNAVSVHSQDEANEAYAAFEVLSKEKKLGTCSVTKASNGAWLLMSSGPYLFPCPLPISLSKAYTRN
jgi:hypothetical protein